MICWLIALIFVWVFGGMRRGLGGWAMSKVCILTLSPVHVQVPPKFDRNAKSVKSALWESSILQEHAPTIRHFPWGCNDQQAIHAFRIPGNSPSTTGRNLERQITNRLFPFLFQLVPTQKQKVIEDRWSVSEKFLFEVRFLCSKAGPGSVAIFPILYPRSWLFLSHSPQIETKLVDLQLNHQTTSQKILTHPERPERPNVLRHQAFGGLMVGWAGKKFGG